MAESSSPVETVKTTETKTPESESPNSLWTANTTRDVRWTEIGLILLVVNGALLIFHGFFWFYGFFDYVRVLEYLGLILFAFGAALIVLARKSFGPKHSDFVILSGSISAVMYSLSLTGGFTLIFNLIRPPVSGIIVALAALNNIPAVLLTYELQGSRGHMVLLTGYAAGLAWSATLANQSLTGPLAVLAGPISIPLTLAPAGIFTLGFYLAYFRLRRREIPIPVSASQSLSESLLS